MNNLQIPSEYKNNLKYIHNISWQDIFAVWRGYEAYQKKWKKHWEKRGFQSWDEWRKNYIAPIKPATRKWSVWQIEKPMKTLSNIYGVPSKGWQKHFYPNNRFTISLKDLLKLSKNRLNKHPKIQSIKNNFPYQTMLTGVISNNKIILVEGMHRSLAILLMKSKKINSNIVFALSKIEDDWQKSLGRGDLEK